MHAEINWEENEAVARAIATLIGAHLDVRHPHIYITAAKQMQWGDPCLTGYLPCLSWSECVERLKRIKPQETP